MTIEEEFLQCRNIVETINQGIYEYIENAKMENLDTCFKNGTMDCYFEEYNPLTIVSNGTAIIIEFYGMQIWNSDEDDRPYINEVDLQVYLNNQIKECYKKFSEIYNILSEKGYFD